MSHVAVYAETPDYEAEYLQDKGIHNATRREKRALRLGRQMAIRAVDETEASMNQTIRRWQRYCAALAVVASMSLAIAWRFSPLGVDIPEDPRGLGFETAMAHLESHVDERIRRSAMRVVGDEAHRMIVQLQWLRDNSSSQAERERAEAVLRNLQQQLTE